MLLRVNDPPLSQGHHVRPPFLRVPAKSDAMGHFFYMMILDIRTFDGLMQKFLDDAMATTNIKGAGGLQQYQHCQWFPS